MIVVNGFYSILKLFLIVLKGFVKRSDVAEADEETDTQGAMRDARLKEIFLASKVPVWIMLGGYALCCAFCVCIVGALYHVPMYQVLIAVLLTPVFAVGIVVGVGMTDWDVSSSFGQLMLLPFGAMNRGGSLVPALAACVITISGCGAAAGMMQNFKTGYLLGASPVTMILAQLVGAAAGVIIAPGMFQVFKAAYTFPGDPSKEAIAGIFGSSYRILAGVFATGGIAALPMYTPYFCLAFAALAIALNLSSDFLPKGITGVLPNPMAMSIGMMMGPGVGIDFLIGGLAISAWRSINPVACEKFGIIVASGCLAGGGIGQVIQIALSSCGLEPFAWPAAA